jgi:hypothetical protein
MAEPASFDEYNSRFHANQKYSGFGLDTTIHMPCGFCGSPDFMVAKVIDTESVMKRGATCKECGRSLKAIFTHHPAGGKSFEFVQTGGPDAPAWLPPIRRVA